MVFLLAALAPLDAHAGPFDSGDPKIGKKLVEHHCVACHVSLFGGDGSEIYTRSNRKVKSAAQLLAQIRLCNSSLDTRWFPDEEEHAAAFLNQHYYKFK